MRLRQTDDRSHHTDNMFRFAAPVVPSKKRFSPAKLCLSKPKSAAMTHFLCIAPFLVLTIAATGFAATPIADHNQTAYRIVIGADSIKSEPYAAEELQHYLEKMSGARLPIVTDAEKPVA